MKHPFNQEQLDFLQSYHEMIEFGVICAKFLNDWTIIDKFIASERYQALFSEYCWDDVRDYYEDTPIYDNTLWLKLHEQLRSISEKW